MGELFQQSEKIQPDPSGDSVVLLAAAAMPMLFAGRTIGASDLLPIYATLILLKIIHLDLQELALKIGDSKVRKKNDLYLVARRFYRSASRYFFIHGLRRYL